MALSFVKMKRPESAVAAGITFLAAREPFSSMKLGSVVSTVSAAVQRGHYVLAVDDGRVSGFVVWALMDIEEARRWFAGETAPSFDRVMDGDTVVLMLGGGDRRSAVMQGVRHIGTLYPGRNYLIRRHGRARPQVGRFPPARRGDAAAG